MNRIRPIVLSKPPGTGGDSHVSERVVNAEGQRRTLPAPASAQGATPVRARAAGKYRSKMSSIVLASAFDSGGNGDRYEVSLRRSCARMTACISAADSLKSALTRWIAKARPLRHGWVARPLAHAFL